MEAAMKMKLEFPSRLLRCNTPASGPQAPGAIPRSQQVPWALQSHAAHYLWGDSLYKYA